MNDPRSATTPLPLQGLRVLDLSSLYAGPWIATALADFGADVIKVEHPRGDDARRWGPSKDGVPLWWKVISRNKRLVCLDLHGAQDQRTARRLAQNADVVIENFRPGRLARWGLDYATIATNNPGLVMLHVTGFGQTGPRSGDPGFGTLAEAFSGFAHMTGQPDGPPTLPPFGLADGVAALSGTMACLVALYWRDVRGGTGQEIDLSLYEPLFSVLGPQVVEYTQLGVIQQRRGNRSPRTSPRNAYRCSDDRWVVISAGTQQIADRIFSAIERPELADDSRFASAYARRENAEVLDDMVAGWISEHTQDEVLTAFADAQAPIAPVYDTAQIVRDPQYQQRESIVTVSDPELGTVSMQNVFPILSRTPGRVRHTGHTAVGADDDTISRWWTVPRAGTREAGGDGRPGDGWAP